MKNLLKTYKNNKFSYYLRGAYLTIYPATRRRRALLPLLMQIEQLNEADHQAIADRVAYYNPVQATFDLQAAKANPETLQPLQKICRIREFYAEQKKTYFFDIVEHLKYFNPDFWLSYEFGDVTHRFTVPTLIKSRPISRPIENRETASADPIQRANLYRHSILLNLDKVRHFNFIRDPIKFADKKPQLLFRGACYQPHRQQFVKRFYQHPDGNIGQTNLLTKQEITDKTAPAWQASFMPIREQLRYKYILCLEGNDVATNLKWVMSSNSLAMMPRPQYETWFMEGRLQAGKHYVELAEDASDFAEKIAYYEAHPEQARQIIANAHAFVSQFQNPHHEKLITLLVLNQYFYYANAARLDDELG